MEEICLKSRPENAEMEDLKNRRKELRFSATENALTNFIQC